MLTGTNHILKHEVLLVLKKSQNTWFHFK